MDFHQAESEYKRIAKSAVLPGQMLAFVRLANLNTPITKDWSSVCSQFAYMLPAHETVMGLLLMRLGFVPPA